ncbi:MAG: flagellar motor switch protein FliM [Candidatus Kapaibacterium sp.]|nr:flagellar motor switch protein FliM [Ignavibacteriota bacterium]MCB9221520.1 flagellar motor switch protein FliM [Ignavibacteria bacterium]MCB9222374.1 flagellar motor switch protein FliM [Ignavibacteria bacterium]
MSQSLTQKEIDRLLNDMSSGALSIDQILEGAKRKSEVMNYDFRRPNRISKNQIRFLQNIHETFSEVFGYYLVSKLQTIVSVDLTAVDQLFYSEFILSVNSPGCLYIFDIDGTEGSGILEVSPNLALNLVERMLGGSAETQQKARSITPIEQAVLRNLIEHLFSDLSNAWDVIGGMKFKLNRMESEADFVQIAPASEIVIVLSFDVHIGQNSYSMTLCYPTFSLEDKLNKLNVQTMASSSINSNKTKNTNSALNIKKQMEKTVLPISVELGQTSITVADLLKLEVGDLIMSTRRISEDVEISISGQKKLTGKIGNVEGKKAVKVTGKIRNEDIIDPNVYYYEEN